LYDSRARDAAVGAAAPVAPVRWPDGTLSDLLRASFCEARAGPAVHHQLLTS
jgi:hypothetical protein